VLERGAQNRTGTVATGGGPAEGSDLFKAQEQDKIRLRQRIQDLTLALDRESKARQELEEKAQADATKIAELGRRAGDSEREAELMTQRHRKLLAAAGKSVRLEGETADLAKEVAEQRDIIDELRASSRKKINMLESAVQNLAVLRGEREDLYFNMAVLYTTSEMYRDAEQAFLKLLALTPDAADVHYNLGILYDQHLKNRSKAVAHYRKYLKLAPDSDDSLQVNLWLTELDVKM
jgi:tetratricopeptide (TPR) repeat protein